MKLSTLFTSGLLVLLVNVTNAQIGEPIEAVLPTLCGLAHIGMKSNRNVSSCFLLMLISMDVSLSMTYYPF